MLYVGLTTAFAYDNIFEYPCPNYEILSPAFIQGNFGSKSFLVNDSKDLSSIIPPLLPFELLLTFDFLLTDP